MRTAQQKARVRDSGGSGIADQGDIQSAEDTFLHQLDRLILIEFVVRLEPTVDVVMMEEDGTGPGVLRQDEVGLFQDLDGPESHVVQVPDRSRDDVQPSRHQPSFLRMAIMKL